MVTFNILSYCVDKVKHIFFFLERRITYYDLMFDFLKQACKHFTNSIVPRNRPFDDHFIMPEWCCPTLGKLMTGLDHVPANKEVPLEKSK